MWRRGELLGADEEGQLADDKACLGSGGQEMQYGILGWVPAQKN